MPPRRLVCIFALTLFVLTARAQDVNLQIIAINDFHGNLQSPGKMAADKNSPSVPVGGADYLAGYVEHLKTQSRNNLVVAGGDLVGASPLISALFHDEPTIEIMNRLGLDLTSVGNHEFDKGWKELLRKQNGGCFANDKSTCQGAQVGTPVPFEGAKFKYLSANVIVAATGKTLFPGYAIKTVDGVRIAFIGLVLKDAPTIISPIGTAGLRFTDEADATNAIVRRLRKQGIRTFVVLIHQGGFQSTKGITDINGCEGDLNGHPIADIVHHLDNGVALVVSAHTHVAYNCQVRNSEGRLIPVTQAANYGRVVTSIDMTLNKRSGTATSVIARNYLVDRTNPDIKPDPIVAAIANKYIALAAPLSNREVGTITAAIPKRQNPAGESPMGDVIADIFLATTRSAATGNAVIAFTNTGGVRTDLPFNSDVPGMADGKVTYEELFKIQPFGNVLTTVTLTGEQIRTVLEEQFKGCGLGYPAGTTPPTTTRLLQVSAGFSYTWNPDAAACQRVVPGSIKLNGKPIAPDAKYRVTITDFLASGGESLPILTQGTDRVGGPPDIDATTTYFAEHPAVSPPILDRIHVTREPKESDQD